MTILWGKFLYINVKHNRKDDTFMNNYNYYQQPFQSRIQAATALKGRPVSSLEEVRAIPIDFDGSIFYFPSLTNDKIYTKQINLDGTSAVRVYELAELPIQNNITIPDNLVTKEEFENKIRELSEQIAQVTIKEKVIESPQVAAPQSTPPAQTAPTFNF